MPLIKSKSNQARSENIGKEIAAGKNPKQAAAIAYAVQRRARKMADGGVTTAADEGDWAGLENDQADEPGAQSTEQLNADAGADAGPSARQRAGKALGALGKGLQSPVNGPAIVSPVSAGGYNTAPQLNMAHGGDVDCYADGGEATPMRRVTVEVGRPTGVSVHAGMPHFESQRMGPVALGHVEIAPKEQEKLAASDYAEGGDVVGSAAGRALGHAAGAAMGNAAQRAVGVAPRPQQQAHIGANAARSVLSGMPANFAEGGAIHAGATHLDEILHHLRELHAALGTRPYMQSGVADEHGRFTKQASPEGAMIIRETHIEPVELEGHRPRGTVTDRGEPAVALAHGGHVMGAHPVAHHSAPSGLSESRRPLNLHQHVASELHDAMMRHVSHYAAGTGGVEAPPASDDENEPVPALENAHAALPGLGSPSRGIEQAADTLAAREREVQAHPTDKTARERYAEGYKLFENEGRRYPREMEKANVEGLFSEPKELFTRVDRDHAATAPPEPNELERIETERRAALEEAKPGVGTHIRHAIANGLLGLAHQAPIDYAARERAEAGDVNAEADRRANAFLTQPAALAGREAALTDSPATNAIRNVWGKLIGDPSLVAGLSGAQISQFAPNVLTAMRAQDANTRAQLTAQLQLSAQQQAAQNAVEVARHNRAQEGLAGERNANMVHAQKAKETGALNSALDRAHRRADYQQAAKAQDIVSRGRQILQLLREQGDHPSAQAVALLKEELGKLASGGVPGAHLLTEMADKTVQKRLSDLAARLTGDQVTAGDMATVLGTYAPLIDKLSRAASETQAKIDREVRDRYEKNPATGEGGAESAQDAESTDFNPETDVE